MDDKDTKTTQKQTEHYICLGGCRGVSQTPCVCQSSDCVNHNHSLVKCDCMDELHNNFKILSVVSVDPISHASMILNWSEMNLYVDPVGADLYTGKPASDIILLTDMHEDHFDAEALKSITKENTIS